MTCFKLQLPHKAEMHGCGCHNIFNSIVNADIPDYPCFPTFYSLKEAKAAGWVMSDHWYFSPDERAVFVCPECAKKGSKYLKQ